MTSFLSKGAEVSVETDQYECKGKVVAVNDVWLLVTSTDGIHHIPISQVIWVTEMAKKKRPKRSLEERAMKELDDEFPGTKVE